MPERRPFSLDELHKLSGLPTDPESLQRAKEVLPSYEEVLEEMGAEFISSAEAHTGQHRETGKSETKESWATPTDAGMNYLELYNRVSTEYNRAPNDSDLHLIWFSYEEMKYLVRQNQEGKLSDVDYIRNVKLQHAVLQAVQQSMKRRNNPDGSG